MKLRLSGTPMLGGVTDEEALRALGEACRMRDQLRLDLARVQERLAAARRIDPVKLVTGRSSLERACAEIEELIRRLDEYLSLSAERSLAGR